MVNKAVPGSMPALPAGFAEKYSKETAASDDASKFAKKDELLAIHKQQRAAAAHRAGKTKRRQARFAYGIRF